MIDGFLFGLGFAVGVGTVWGVVGGILCVMDRLNPDLFIAD